MIREGSGTLGEVQDGSGDTRRGLGRVRDPRGGPVFVGKPTQKSTSGRGTLEEGQDGSGNPRGGPGLVWGHLGRFGFGQGTLGEVQDGSVEPLGGLIRVGDPQGGP